MFFEKSLYVLSYIFQCVNLLISTTSQNFPFVLITFSKKHGVCSKKSSFIVISPSKKILYKHLPFQYFMHKYLKIKETHTQTNEAKYVKSTPLQSKEL